MLEPFLAGKVSALAVLFVRANRKHTHQQKPRAGIREAGCFEGRNNVWEILGISRPRGAMS